MSRRLKPLEAPVTIELDGHQLPAREGEPVAAALLAHGEKVFSRSAKYHRPRGPFCLSGGCSHCLMRVDGVPNVPTCRVPVKPGLRLERQNAFPDASIDLLSATDWAFPSWFNHHEFLAGIPLADKVLTAVARKLSGLGLLPDQVPPPREAALREQVSLAVVGAGAAGLAAARGLQERGVPYALFERAAEVGGRLTSGPEPRSVGWTPPAEALRLRSLVVGLFADQGQPFLAVVREGRLELVAFRRLLLTTGGHPTLPTFENNDLPGIFASRAVSSLIRQHGVLPGQRLAVVGDAQEARELAALIASVGGEPVAVGAEPLKAHGVNEVHALTVKQDGAEQKVACDAVALCAPVSPAFELARAGGARVVWDPRARLFVVEADDQGRTASPSVFVAGELRGPMSVSAAAEQGLVVAQTLAALGAA